MGKRLGQLETRLGSGGQRQHHAHTCLTCRVCCRYNGAASDPTASIRSHTGATASCASVLSATGRSASTETETVHVVTEQVTIEVVPTRSTPSHETTVPQWFSATSR